MLHDSIMLHVWKNSRGEMQCTALDSEERLRNILGWFGYCGMVWDLYKLEINAVVAPNVQNNEIKPAIAQYLFDNLEGAWVGYRGAEGGQDSPTWQQIEMFGPAG